MEGRGRAGEGRGRAEGGRGSDRGRDRGRGGAEEGKMIDNKASCVSSMCMHVGMHTVCMVYK